MTRPELIVEHLNRALHALLTRHPNLYLLGEDVTDPYGGAFRVTKGLSSAHPSRVLSTPISEGGIIGVANGLALAGDKAIVELMFCDFATLAFDQLLNFSAKSVAMYGQRVAMPLVVRCPVGGHRGYGPTHSQSLQKHFIGIPHLALFELSAYHDPGAILDRALGRDHPGIVFEPKLLYGHRYLGPGLLDDSFHCELLADGDWAHVAPLRPAGPALAVIAPGGTADLVVRAARTMAASGDATVHVLVPAQLYPLDLHPILPLLRTARSVFTAEESTAGGTWGAEVATQVHRLLWDDLRHPVVCLHSRDSVIPAAPHLERAVLLQEADVLAALRGSLLLPHRGHSPEPEFAVVKDATGSDAHAVVVVPKLNNNDDGYVLLSWLVADGAAVASGQAIAEVETSKAVEELPAPSGGILRHEVAAGSDCTPGGCLAHIIPFDRPGAGRAPEAPPEPAKNRRGGRPAPMVPALIPPGSAKPTVALGRGQQRVGAVVSRSRGGIPDAFVVLRASLDAFHAIARTMGPAGGPSVELLDIMVKLIGALRERFPSCFAELTSDLTRLRHADQAHVGITLDAGNGLFIPVVRSVEHRTVDEIADVLADYRLRALRGTFLEHQLVGANIIISWNAEPGVVLVQPIIPPGLACAVAVGGELEDWVDDGTGRPRRARGVNLALAHDHRIVNGAEAVRFLAALAVSLADGETLSRLVKNSTS